MSLWLWFCFKYMKTWMILDVCIDITWSEYTAWITTKYCSCFRCSLLAYNIIVHLSTPKRYIRLDSDSKKSSPGTFCFRWKVTGSLKFCYPAGIVATMEDCGAGEMIIYHGKDDDHYRKSQTLSVCLSLAVTVCLSLSLSLSCLCLSVCISGLNECKLQSL